MGAVRRVQCADDIKLEGAVPAVVDGTAHAGERRACGAKFVVEIDQEQGAVPGDPGARSATHAQLVVPAHAGGRVVRRATGHRNERLAKGGGTIALGDVGIDGGFTAEIVGKAEAKERLLVELAVVGLRHRRPGEVLQGHVLVDEFHAEAGGDGQAAEGELVFHKDGAVEDVALRVAQDRAVVGSDRGAGFGGVRRVRQVKMQPGAQRVLPAQGLVIVADARLETPVVELLPVDAGRRPRWHGAETAAVLPTAPTVVVSGPGFDAEFGVCRHAVLQFEAQRVTAQLETVIEAHRLMTVRGIPGLAQAARFAIFLLEHIHADDPARVFILLVNELHAAAVCLIITVGLPKTVGGTMGKVAMIAELPDCSVHGGVGGDQIVRAHDELLSRPQRAVRARHESDVIQRPRRLRAIDQRGSAAQKVDALHRLQRRCPIGLRIANGIGADGDAILQDLHELGAVRAADAAIPQADQGGGFFRHEQPRSQGKSLAIVVGNHFRQCLEFNDGGAFAGIHLRPFHRRQIGNLDGWFFGLSRDRDFRQVLHGSVSRRFGLTHCLRARMRGQGQKQQGGQSRHGSGGTLKMWKRVRFHENG